MIQAYILFARMMMSLFHAWKLSLQITETMIASHAVIGALMGMLGKGLDGTGKKLFAEFGRLIARPPGLERQMVSPPVRWDQRALWGGAFRARSSIIAW